MKYKNRSGAMHKSTVLSFENEKVTDGWLQMYFPNFTKLRKVNIIEYFMKHGNHTKHDKMKKKLTHVLLFISVLCKDQKLKKKNWKEGEIMT